jgi:AcrR family transcriptional regulator
MTAELPRYLQLLWGVETPGRRGPKPGQSIESIGQAAVRIADAHGLDAVSMKAVANEVGMTTMSLYRYLDAKDQLYEVMLHCAYGQPEPGLTSRGSWRSRLERWCLAIADRILAHPWTARAPMSGPPRTPNVLRWTDAGLRALSPTNLTEKQKLSALLAADGYVRSHVSQSLQIGAIGPAAGSEQVQWDIAGLLDEARFPALIAATPALEDDDEDFFTEELAFGLTLVLDGIERLIERNAGTGSSRRRATVGKNLGRM